MYLCKQFHEALVKGPKTIQYLAHSLDTSHPIYNQLQMRFMQWASTQDLIPADTTDNLQISLLYLIKHELKPSSCLFLSPYRSVYNKWIPINRYYSK